jgi:hypothetical protein
MHFLQDVYCLERQLFDDLGTKQINERAAVWMRAV